LLHRLTHWFRRNSRAGSKKNIHAHYDIGNDFYRLWLDVGMSYSSALYGALEPNQLDDEANLVAAQNAKMNRALVQIGAAPGLRIAEIGCGWGALAEMAVQHFGAEIDGITLSDEQLQWGLERLGRQQLGEQARLMKLDCRGEH
jgi:cyclopropane-fatty-acyl-phospholipid synthase